MLSSSLLQTKTNNAPTIYLVLRMCFERAFWTINHPMLATCIIWKIRWHLKKKLAKQL